MSTETMEMAPVRSEEPQPLDWAIAARRAIASKNARDQMISEALTPGLDYGVIPGTQKPTLLKAGAEKVTDSLNLWADYRDEGTIERTDDADPLYVYRFRCLLRQRGTDTVVAAGIATCSSLESRYRWRKAERVCPQCGSPAIIKGKAEYGGGWLCWAKRGGCGEKYEDGDESIVGQVVERIPNPDIHDVQNTVCKMAQKRALVAAVLNLGLSDKFTQDMEDLDQPPAAAANGAAVEGTATNGTGKAETVRQPQRKAKAEEAATETPNPVVCTPTQVKVSRTGTNSTGPWTLYVISTTAGEFGTFDESEADLAGSACKRNAEVRIGWELTKKKNRNIKTLEIVEE